MADNELSVNFSLSENNLSPTFKLSEAEDFDILLQIDAAPTKTSQLENDSLIEDVTGSGLINASKNNQTVTITSQTYIFEQGIASDIWVINHNLNKYPSVTVVDTAETVFTAQVEYNDKNTCTVYINGSTKGKAYLN